MKPILKTKYSLVGASAALALVLSGCTALEQITGGSSEAVEAEAVETEVEVEVEVEEVVEAAADDAEAMVQETVEEAVEMTAEAKLVGILGAQPEEVQARYGARNPAETLAFFGIEPGMKVAEALPGGGWYSKILIPYLGEDGALVGAHYPDELWPMFGFGEEWAAGRIEATANWPT